MSKKNRDGKKSKDGKKPLPDTGMLNGSLTLAARSLRTLLSRNLLESGLYAGQDGVILALAESEEGLSPGMLAQRLGVKAPTMTRTIARMEAQGFVSRANSDGDGRGVRVQLTDAGRVTVADISKCIHKAEAAVTEPLDRKEIRQLVKLLRKLDKANHPESAK